MSAEKISKLEQLLARVAERKEQPATRLRIVSEAEPVVEAAPAEGAPVVEVAAEATLRDATPAPVPVEPAVAETPIEPEPEVAEPAPEPELAPEPEPAATPLAEPSEPEVAEVEISDDDLDGVDLDADAEALFEPVEEETLDKPAEEAADEEELLVEETTTSATPATQRSEPPTSEEAVTIPQPVGEVVPPTKVTIEEEPATSEVATEKRPDVAAGPPPLPAQDTQVSGTAVDALSASTPSKPLELTRRQDEVEPSKPVELVTKAEPASEEVAVSVPAAPEAAPSLGEIEPVVLEPVRLARENVGDFVTEVAKPSEGSFGDLIDAALELGF